MAEPGKWDEALALGMVLGMMMKHKAPAESFKAVLSLPEAKAIARQEPQRLLGQMCRQYGVSFEEEDNGGAVGQALSTDARH